MIDQALLIVAVLGLCLDHHAISKLIDLISKCIPTIKVRKATDDDGQPEGAAAVPVAKRSVDDDGARTGSRTAREVQRIEGKVKHEEALERARFGE